MRGSSCEWSRRAFRALGEIPPTKDDLDRRLKVFGGNHFGVAPTIRLHGVEFRAAMPVDARAAVQAESS